MGNVLFLANFNCNDATFPQFGVLVMLCESLIRSMTIVLPFFPHATMERVVEEGTVATANTTAKLISSLPQPGAKNRVMMYDLHELGTRFYYGAHTMATLHTTFPLILEQVKAKKISAVCF